MNLAATAGSVQQARRITRRIAFAGVAGSGAALAAACGAGGAPAAQEPSGGPRRNATLRVIYPPTSEADLRIFTQIFRRFEEQ